MNYWIPCWAAMPEEVGGISKPALVTVTDGVNRGVQIAWTVEGAWAQILSNQTVIAWMPLPPVWEGKE